MESAPTLEPSMYRITTTRLDHNNVEVDATCAEVLGDLFDARFESEEDALAAAVQAFGDDEAATCAAEWVNE